MNCPTCGAEAALTDNFCPGCGTSIRNSRLPVKREPPPSPEIFRRTLVRQAGPAIARAGAFVAAGVLAQWLLRSAGRKALTVPTARKKTPAQPLVRREEPAREPVVAISETVVWRRIIVRR